MDALLWPGDDRAGDTFTDAAVLHAMVAVEQAWLDSLRPGTGADLAALLEPADVASLAAAGESAGNPVVPLVRVLRARLPEEPARWLHRGLTSQDVLDTALVLCARAATTRVQAHLDALVDALAELVRRHRDDLAAARTLTQHAVPTTVGLRTATWLTGVLDARDDLARLRFAAQLGGAAGTLAAPVELLGGVDEALAAVGRAAATLGLDDRQPWHTARAPITRIGDALVTTTDALGHLARDVLSSARPEVAEVAEPAAEGRGGSSTMPHKRNPVLSVLVRRAALAAPALGAQLHLAAAEQVDERADGGWHVEWSTLALLARRTVVAASQAAELAAGLEVDTGASARRAEAVADDLLAERTPLLALNDHEAGGEPDPDPRSYLGAATTYVDRVLERAHTQEAP